MSAISSAAGTVTVHLIDGRAIDISGLTAAQAIARLRAAGITLADIKQTVHVLPAGALTAGPHGAAQ